MIGFVVPIKPKKTSKNWDFDNLLLQRTAQSICAQTDQSFRLIIVYTDMPEINFSHENLMYVQFPFGATSINDFEDMDYVLKYHSPEYAEKMMDKGKKIHFGCSLLMKEGCTYMMAIDSDDLIHNSLAEFVNSRVKENRAGWRINKGYVYEENSIFLIKKPDIYNVNGSTHIIRKDLITVPDFSSNLFWNYNLFEAHGYTYGRIRDFHNEILEEYPFYGTVYTIHGNNYSGISKRIAAISVRNILKKIVRGRFLSKSIRKEFGLYKLTAEK